MVKKVRKLIGGVPVYREQTLRFRYCCSSDILVLNDFSILSTSRVQRTLVITITFVPQDSAVKKNLPL